MQSPDPTPAIIGYCYYKGNFLHSTIELTEFAVTLGERGLYDKSDSFISKSWFVFKTLL